MNATPPRGLTPAVVLVNPKYPHNVGAALRACSCFGLKQLWWTGDRVTVDPVRGERLPREERMRGYSAVAMCPHDRPFDFLPDTAVPVAVEVRPQSECLTVFEHPEEAVYVANGLRPYIPLLIALSANSPLWRGEPTGLMSSRVPIFRAFPRVGLPPRFEDWADFDRRVGILSDSGVIDFG